MKLKSLLKESSLKVLDRKFGEPLPTLEDTTKAYKLKKEQEVKEPVKEDILSITFCNKLQNIVLSILQNYPTDVDNTRTSVNFREKIYMLIIYQMIK